MKSDVATKKANITMCIWCSAPYKHVESKAPICLNCGLNPIAGVDPVSVADGNPIPRGISKRGRTDSAKTSTRTTGNLIVGVDPGARYTGVVVCDGERVLHASTLVRPEEMKSPTEWALVVVGQVQRILADFPSSIPMGVEGISDPKGFQNGKHAAINPKDIIRAGIVLGAVVATWPHAVIIKPGNNGSRAYSKYPAELVGRRPGDLPGSSQGAGTRGHEQSAYDVATKAAEVLFPPPSLF